MYRFVKTTYNLERRYIGKTANNHLFGHGPEVVLLQLAFSFYMLPWIYITVLSTDVGVQGWLKAHTLLGTGELSAVSWGGVGLER